MIVLIKNNKYVEWDRWSTPEIVLLYPRGNHRKAGKLVQMLEGRTLHSIVRYQNWIRSISVIPEKIRSFVSSGSDCEQKNHSTINYQTYCLITLDKVRVCAGSSIEWDDHVRIIARRDFVRHFWWPLLKLTHSPFTTSFQATWIILLFSSQSARPVTFNLFYIFCRMQYFASPSVAERTNMECVKTKDALILDIDNSWKRLGVARVMFLVGKKGTLYDATILISELGGLHIFCV